jgi:hypothetical protein
MPLARRLRRWVMRRRVDAQGASEALELGDRRVELGVADVGELHGDHDRGRSA